MTNTKNEIMLRPTFIGIGAMKCATTWVSECLRYHPEVFMSSPKEIHYFSYNYNKNLDWYLEHFKEAKGYKVRGEFSVSYLPDHEAPRKIANDISKNIKLICSLRDPVERFVSHYKHYLRSNKLDGHLTYSNYKEAIKKYPNLLEIGRYSSQIESYIDIFGLDSIKIIIKEEIDKKPKQVLKELYSFLDVDKEFIPSIFSKKVSPGITPKIKLLEELRDKTHKWSQKWAPWFIDFVKKYRIVELYRKLNKKDEFKVDSRVKNELYKYYIDDIEKTEKILNIKLDMWKK